MSLDVYLHSKGHHERVTTGIYIREYGSVREISAAEWHEKFPDTEPYKLVGESDEVYWANITHNLGKMATEVDIYWCLWRPDENSITHASQLIGPLEVGLFRLKDHPDHWKTFNPENGWGTYDGFVKFVERYLDACKLHPDAQVRVSR